MMTIQSNLLLRHKDPAGSNRPYHPQAVVKTSNKEELIIQEVVGTVDSDQFIHCKTVITKICSIERKNSVVVLLVQTVIVNNLFLSLTKLFRMAKRRQLVHR
jgi:hypothetical protein